MQDSGLYNELDEKQMVRYSDIVKGSITKYEGLKDETEKNTYTTIQSSSSRYEDAQNNKYERLEGESEKNIYGYMNVQKKDVPKYVSVIDDEEEDKDMGDKVGDDEDGYLKPGSRNSQESGISLEKNKDNMGPVTNDIGNSQFTSNIHADGHLDPVGNNPSSTQVNGVSSKYPVQNTVINETDKDSDHKANHEHSQEMEKDNPNYISVIDDDSEGKRLSTALLEIHRKVTSYRKTHTLRTPYSMRKMGIWIRFPTTLVAVHKGVNMPATLMTMDI